MTLIEVYYEFRWLCVSMTIIHIAVQVAIQVALAINFGVSVQHTTSGALGVL